MKKGLITNNGHKSPMFEIFKNLGINIECLNNAKSILITSALPEEGKTWIASNLAITFAQAGKKVILVDANMRKGKIETIFELNQTPGLSNYLSETGFKNEEAEEDLANYIQETDIDNLYVITSGSIPQSPSELLVSEKMVDLIAKLNSLCDILIFDGAPVKPVIDSIALSKIVDATLIVAECNRTKKEELRKTIDSIKNVGGKILGVVLNKVNKKHKKKGQEYFYGSVALVTTKPTSRTARKVNEKVHEKTSNMKEKKETIKLELTNEKEDLVEELKNEDKTKHEEEIEIPKVVTKNTIKETPERTTEILNKINKYLDEEKKKLKQ